MTTENKATKANSSTNLLAYMSATQRLAENKRKKQSMLRAIAKIEEEESLIERGRALQKQAIIDEKIHMNQKRKARTPGQTMILGRIVWTAYDNEPKFATYMLDIIKKYPAWRAERDRLAPHFGLKHSQAVPNVDDTGQSGSTKPSMNPVGSRERQTEAAEEADTGAIVGELNAGHLGRNFQASTTNTGLGTIEARLSPVDGDAHEPSEI